ncbi:MAG: heme utilization cystosolic carrier protein HutX [Pseudomonadota bacterium]
MSLTQEQRSAIRATLTDKPGSVLESVAAEHNVCTADVVACLPDDEAVVVDGAHFESVMGDLTEWGEVLFIVHTADLVFEVRGEIPPGTTGRGYYNLHGSPIGGHLKADRCESIAFVSRQLFSKQSRSIHFYSIDGDCMFKIYVLRDEQGEMLKDQVSRFCALAARLSEG